MTTRPPPPLHHARVVVRLAISLLILLGLTLGAGYLLTRAQQGDVFERADGALVRWLAGRRTDVLTALSGPVGELGNTWFVIGAGVVAAAVACVVWHRWRPLLLLAVALCGELAVFLTTAALIDRPRPPVPHLDEELPPTSSFPSGHTAAAICLYGAIAALVLARTRGRWRGVVLTGVIVVVAVVAASRLYRGAHYPTDVLASVLFALPWLLVVLRALPLRPVADEDEVGERAGRVGE